MNQERLPGRWRNWCQVCKSYRCGDPVYGKAPSRRYLRSGWRGLLAREWHWFLHKDELTAERLVRHLRRYL